MQGAAVHHERHRSELTALHRLVRRRSRRGRYRRAAFSHPQYVRDLLFCEPGLLYRFSWPISARSEATGTLVLTCTSFSGRRQSEATAPKAPPAACEANCAHHCAVRLSRAKLLKRLFDLDLVHCPNCGGGLKIIAAILEQPVKEKILTHLGLQARAPPRAPARGPLLHAA